MRAPPDHLIYKGVSGVMLHSRIAHRKLHRQADFELISWPEVLYLPGRGVQPFEPIDVPHTLVWDTAMHDRVGRSKSQLYLLEQRFPGVLQHQGVVQILIWRDRCRADETDA